MYWLDNWIFWGLIVAVTVRFAIRGMSATERVGLVRVPIETALRGIATLRNRLFSFLSVLVSAVERPRWARRIKRFLSDRLSDRLPGGSQ